MFRRRHIQYGILFAMLLWSLSSEAQQRCRWFKNFDRPFVLDSATIIPSSIFIGNDPLAGITYDVNSGNAIIEKGSKDSVKVCYLPIAYNLSKEVYRRSYTAYKENQLMQRSFADTSAQKAFLVEREELFGSGQLYKSGSLTRGISFGNTQDVFVNSALNLQLEGQLADNLNIRAAITDQNVPFQPEGNTARVQEFDNVFIEMYNDQLSVKGGDIILTNPETEFLRFRKNVQGGLADVQYKIGNQNARTKAGISLAKGQFASIALDVQEGVQGPYRIPIPGGVTAFTIIMAGSERVFLDGRQLQRGFNNDYVIDYNQAEITFTGNVLITQFSRVRIDIEYSDQQFNRTIITAGHEQNIGNNTLYVHHYSEKDNENQAFGTDLTADEAAYLATIGDSLELAFTDGAREVEYNSDEVQYVITDTLFNGSTFEIYRIAEEEQSPVYRVSFNDVGQGQGDYVLKNTSVSGRVFEWVGPGNGRYMPLKRLPAPNKKSMTTIGAQIPVKATGHFFGELALTELDLNLFSNIDNDDNSGYAYRLGYRLQEKVKLVGEYQLTGHLTYEYDNENFSPVDRFRYIEFDRDWSYNPSQSQDATVDQIVNGRFNLEKNPANLLSYEITRRKRGQFIDGFQHQAYLNKSFGNLLLKSQGFLLNNSTEQFTSKWYRLKADLAYQNPYIVPGYIFHYDDNRVFAPESDSVTSTAMNFKEHAFYIEQGDSAKVKYKAQYSYRDDFLPQEGALRPFTTAQTVQMNLEKSAGKQQVSWNMYYRKLDNLLADTAATEETIQGQLNWYGQFINGILRSDLRYGIGNGRELRRDFIYVKVPTGQGTHTWRDDNGDGEKGLNEFYPAVNSDEKNYIRVFTPTNEFVQSYDLMFNYRLSFKLPSSWKGRGGMLKFLHKFSGNAAWTVNRKMLDDNLFNRLSPIEKDLDEKDLLSQRNLLKGTLYYNRNNPDFGMNADYQVSDSKQFLTNGFESRGLDQWSATIRGAVGRTYFLKFRYQNAMERSAADFLEGRTYRINVNEYVPEVSWQPGQRFRLTTTFNLKQKQSLSEENPGSAMFREAQLLMKFNKPGDQSANVRFSWINIDFDGRANSPIGYDLLEALQPGENATWQVIWQKKVIKGLQVSLQYEGRASSDRPVVHIGRMQVSALF
ncbi:MAG TPA: hypothetical protein DDY13_00780 [Cytophagales bacterium]|jgi:hypothetical protein|nr:hypothetical protein [Cytophagales bacterium]